MNDRLDDVLCGLGTMLIAYGAWLVYEPAGFITGGVLCVVGGVFVAKMKAG